MTDAGTLADDAATPKGGARRMSAPLRWLPIAGLLLAVGAVIVLTHGRRADQGLPAPGVGSFGGYAMRADVASVGASWNVPRLLSLTRPGDAGTWIGAQGPNRFVQVGTQEELIPRRGHPVAFYDAWWADTVSHFLARHLFVVRPRDRIDAYLAHDRGRWLVWIRDATSGRAARFLTREEGLGSFDSAEWVQERSPRAPYPRLSSVTFTRLRLNGSAPKSSRLLASWLSTGNGMLGPTPFPADAFTLTAKAVTREGAQYLRFARPADVAGAQLSEAVRRWGGGSEVWPVVRADDQAYASTLEWFGRALASARWASAVEPLIREVIQTSSDYARRLRSLPAVEPRSRERFVAGWTRDAEAADVIAQRARGALGLPNH
jgi:hypothetical protein